MKKTKTGSFWTYFISGGVLASLIFIGSSWIANDSMPLQYVANVDQVIEKKEPEKTFHIKTPETVRGIYMTSWVASTRDWRAGLVKMIEETELNSIVIDVKDYTGKIAFEVSDPEIKKYNSDEKRIDDIKEFINSLHEKNIYVIARIAVFQDPYMVKIKPEWAIQTKTGAIWKDKKGLTWIDPCAKEYWDYIINVSRETEKVGFDELNFDYIRFASDGDMNNIVYSFCEPNIAKADALESFFKYLSENLKDLEVPISADLFGMVTTSFNDMNIGQVLEKSAPYFDYICPMVYPSHYPATYNGFKNPALYPYEVIKLAMDTASQRLITATSTPNKLRPWLQDFDLGADYTAEMVRLEKQAVYDSGLNSWLLWDSSNIYTKEALD